MLATIDVGVQGRWDEGRGVRNVGSIQNPLELFHKRRLCLGLLQRVDAFPVFLHFLQGEKDLLKLHQFFDCLPCFSSVRVLMS